MPNQPSNSRTLTTDHGPITVKIVPEAEAELSFEVTYLAAEPDRTRPRSEVFTPREMALIFQQPPRAPQHYSRIIAKTSAIAASLIIALALWANNHTPSAADASTAPATQPSLITNSPTPANQLGRALDGE